MAGDGTTAGESLITYIIAPSGVEVSTEALVGTFSCDPAYGPIVSCREVPDGAAPADLPCLDESRAASSAAPREECWAAPIDWFSSRLEAGIPPGLAARLVVRISWPVSPESEGALLMARLSCPEVRLAVEVTPTNVEAVFHYLDRFGFAWVATPAWDGPSDAWAESFERLAKLWCFDPRTATTMEPISSAFAIVMDQRLHQRPARWRCRVLDALSRVEDASLDWSPSVHACLTAAPGRALERPLKRLAVSDGRWMRRLGELCLGLDLTKLAPACVEGEPARAGSTA